MGCSNFCTTGNFTQISQTYAGYPISSLMARLGDLPPLADQLREYQQRSKDSARAEIAEAARTAGVDVMTGKTIEQQLVSATPMQDTFNELQQLSPSDPLTSAFLGASIIGTSIAGVIVGALVEAVTNVLSANSLNKD